MSHPQMQTHQNDTRIVHLFAKRLGGKLLSGQPSPLDFRVRLSLIHAPQYWQILGSTHTKPHLDFLHCCDVYLGFVDHLYVHGASVEQTLLPKIRGVYVDLNWYKTVSVSLGGYPGSSQAFLSFWNFHASCLFYLLN